DSKYCLISLAEFYLDTDRYNHASDIKQYLESARDFWAGATDLKLARPRFVKVSFTLADFVTQNWGWYSNVITPIGKAGQTNYVPQPNSQPLADLYKEILKIADKDVDKAKA